MADIPKKAFVLAAGKGERMRPLTDNLPKPLLYVGGTTMLDRALDALEEVGVEEVVVNLYYLPEKIQEHLASRKTPKITFSTENELLETGGGVKKALAFFGDEPFFVLNADVVWTDGPSGSTLKGMAEAWDPTSTDILFLLHPTENLPAYNGKGDYYLPEGSDVPQFRERCERPPNYIFAGPRICKPSIFENSPEGSFSFLELFHKAEAAGRLRAYRHEGDWYHVGTPEAFEESNRTLLAKSQKRAS